MRSPLVAASAFAGLSSSQSALTVGNFAVTSNTPSPRTATTAGPFACGSQTRPTSVPRVPSSGRRSFTVNVVMGVSSLFSDRPRSRRPITLAKTNKRLGREVQRGSPPRFYAPARAFRAAIC
ncbi:hypothetical protein ACVWZ6_004294 [Bradyrhizobium sp. GM6.1]